MTTKTVSRLPSPTGGSSIAADHAHRLVELLELRRRTLQLLGLLIRIDDEMLAARLHARPHWPRQAQQASMRAAATRINRLMKFPQRFPSRRRLAASSAEQVRACLKEAVGVDVDRDADLGAPFEPAQPVADDVLDVEAARGVDQQALAVAAAQHGERGGGRAEHRHAFDARRGLADAAGDGFGLGLVLGRDDDRRQPAERRHRRLAPRLGFGGVEARRRRRRPARRSPARRDRGSGPGRAPACRRARRGRRPAGSAGSCARRRAGRRPAGRGRHRPRRPGSGWGSDSPW